MSEHALLERAESLLDLRRPQDALALASAAVAQDPESVEALCVVARAHLQLENPAAARAAAERAASLAPEDAYPARVAAAALLVLDDVDAARHWAATAIALDATDAASHRMMALLQVDEDAGRAREHAETAIDLSPDDAEGHYVLGIVLQSDGRFRGAEQALRHAVALNPHHAGALSALGATVAHLGAAKDAAELIRLAASTDVRDTSIHQDMLRYVRGAASGLATWPVVAFCLWLFVGALGNDVVSAVLLGSAVALLVLLRERRMRRFPAPVRRILRRREFSRAGWEITVPPGAGTGFRPWWWILLIRVPVAARAAILWPFIVFWSLTGNAIASLIAAPLAAWLTLQAVRVRRRRNALLPRYA